MVISSGQWQRALYVKGYLLKQIILIIFMSPKLIPVPAEGEIY